MEIIGSAVYVVLFAVAIGLPLLGLKPFTYYFSYKSYPAVITKSEAFLRINRTISFVWAGIFALAFILSLLYASPLVPFVPQLLIGIPATVLLPRLLLARPENKITFHTSQESFEAMPLGINPKTTASVDATIGVVLTGDEAGEHTLTIRHGKCTYQAGLLPNPNLTIKADSSVWLSIVNGEQDGASAMLKGDFAFEGDGELMLGFESFFDPTATPKTYPNPPQTYHYDTLDKPIKKVVLFDGGMRNAKLSKTTLMTSHFVQGLQSQGIEVATVKLSEKTIAPCDGCYTCWTATPGVCTHRDDMDKLTMMFREADLLVFASPLYVFSVTAVMKNFLDRILPILKPYMIRDDAGHTFHPDRYPQFGAQGVVVFSAGGFPDVAGNFDGLANIFRSLRAHSEYQKLLGEFYLPAAELLAQGVYAKRRASVERACFEAGVELAKTGRISYTHMATVANPMVDSLTFGKQADAFWAGLEGKKAYLRGVPKL